MDHIEPSPDDAFRILLSSPEGRLFLRDLLLSTCGVLSSPMAALAADRDYLLGRQSIGLELVNRLGTDNLAILLKEPRE